MVRRASLQTCQTSLVCASRARSRIRRVIVVLSVGSVSASWTTAGAIAWSAAPYSAPSVR